MARTRESEQRAAAAHVGVADVVFLRYPDGALTASLELRRDITRVIRQVRPDRVLAWSPEINWERATRSAVLTRRRSERSEGQTCSDSSSQLCSAASRALVVSRNCASSAV